ncbi:MAG TPA: hypothetical protein DCL32_10100, partial [Gammaproteobacteria bacterium]|nr:hypothetical protein [Gammaproteobacteria bacterium]
MQDDRVISDSAFLKQGRHHVRALPFQVQPCHHARRALQPAFQQQLCRHALAALFQARPCRHALAAFQVLLCRRVLPPL